MGGEGIKRNKVGRGRNRRDMNKEDYNGRQRTNDGRRVINKNSAEGRGIKRKE